MAIVLSWLLENVFIFLVLLSLMLLFTLFLSLFFSRTFFKRIKYTKSSKIVTVLVGCGVLVSLGFSFFFYICLKEVGQVFFNEQKIVGNEVPKTDLIDVFSGEHVDLKSFSGKTLVVNQWATWCGPCLDEMPALEKLQDHYRSKDVVVVYVSEEELKHVKSFLENRKTKPGLYVKADRLPWSLSTLPSTVIVDSSGVVKKLLVGGQTYGQFQSAIESVH